MTENKEFADFMDDSILDLGSGGASDFDPFAETAVSDENPAEITETKKSDEEEKNKNEKTKTQEKSDDEKSVPGNGEGADLFQKALAAAETKKAQDTKTGLLNKLPVFSYAGADEEIADPSVTFDKLRDDKSEDFPELDDISSVSWKMTYGSIVKTVTTPKKTTVAGLKKEIEESKDFLNSLKKAKGDIVCKVTPSVAAKKKGFCEYKGVFGTVEDAVRSGKAIAFVPSDDGYVYEVRHNRAGTFIAKTERADILPRVRAGFIPAFPPVPYEMLKEIIAFFRKMLPMEAAAVIYRSFADQKYYIYIPKQSVSTVGVDFTVPDMDSENFLPFLEIHSHNTMKAFFSKTDDRDEKATGIYVVVGRLDSLFPEIKARISVGGRFVEIDPAQIFAKPELECPKDWVCATNGEGQL